MTATPGPPPDAAPTGGLLARRRIAIARFGAGVAAAGGIGPALAAGLDPADYPVVPGGVPQAWERAKVYLGLCERYQELYQAQVAELHLLMASVPGYSLLLSHRRPLTDPLTDTHTGYISLIRARRGAATRTTRLSCRHAGGYQMTWPPSTRRSTPVTNDAALLSRKTTGPTMSSGWAFLPRGVSLAYPSMASRCSGRCVIGV